MDDPKTKEEQGHAERGVPTPAPHEEEAKGAPDDGRLQSEVPQSGEKK